MGWVDVGWLRGAIVGALLVTSGVAGCTEAIDGRRSADAQGHEGVEPSRARSLVLQPADFSDNFGRFDSAPDTSGRPGGGGIAEAWVGWVARYRHVAPRATEGPLVVESRARIFENEDGAREGLAAYRGELRSGAARDIGGAPPLGDEAWGVSVQQAAFPRAVIHFTVAWRHQNVLAAVTVQGFKGRVRLADAASLAKKQHARISRTAAT